MSRCNTHHIGYNGVRSIVGIMPDNTFIITGYEISADAASGTNRRSEGLHASPHVRSDEVVAALKATIARGRKFSSSPASEELKPEADRNGYQWGIVAAKSRFRISSAKTAKKMQKYSSMNLQTHQTWLK